MPRPADRSRSTCRTRTCAPRTSSGCGARSGSIGRSGSSTGRGSRAFVRGDWGYSFSDGRPVDGADRSSGCRRRSSSSASSLAAALALTLPVGIVVGGQPRPLVRSRGDDGGRWPASRCRRSGSACCCRSCSRSASAGCPPRAEPTPGAGDLVDHRAASRDAGGGARAACRPPAGRAICAAR